MRRKKDTLTALLSPQLPAQAALEK